MIKEWLINPCREEEKGTGYFNLNVGEKSVYAMLAELIQEGSRGHDRDPTKVFDRLQVAFVSRNQVIRTSRDGAFEDAMVGLVLHEAREVQRWQDAGAHQAQFQNRVTYVMVVPAELVMENAPEFSLNGRRVREVDEACARHAQDRLAGAAEEHG